MIKDLAEGFVLGRDPFRVEALWAEMDDHTCWAKGRRTGGGMKQDVRLSCSSSER